MRVALRRALFQARIALSLNFPMKLLSILGIAVVIILPISVLVGGCGGGSNGPVTPTATPLATSTPTTTSTPTVTASPLPVVNVAPIQFSLSDGRIVTVRLQTQGRHVFGVVETPQAATAAVRRTAVVLPSIPLHWDGSNYAVDGTYTPPLSISLAGQVRQDGITVPFLLRGTLPTETNTGTLSIVVAGRTVTIKIPAIGDLLATPTPLPTATPTSTTTP